MAEFGILRHVRAHPKSFHKAAIKVVFQIIVETLLIHNILFMYIWSALFTQQRWLEEQVINDLLYLHGYHGDESMHSFTNCWLIFACIVTRWTVASDTLSECSPLSHNKCIFRSISKFVYNRKIRKVTIF